MNPSMAELLPVVKGLPRADRLRLVQVLITDLAAEEGVLPDIPPELPLWTPHGGDATAAELMKMLADERAS